MKKLLHIFILLGLAIAGQAQVMVETQLDSAKIQIGEQTNLSISVKAPAKAKITFPEYEPQTELTHGIEVVEMSGDTIEGGDERTITRKYRLTSWDENHYKIPALQVTVDGKAYPTKTFTLDVATVEVDTLHPEKIRPAKDIMDNPFSWGEWMPVILFTILALALLALAAWMAYRLRRNKAVITLPFAKKLLPHQKALNEIEKIKEEQLSRSEDQKTYYTRLTDTLRQYLEDRFNMKAKEMTSGEIVEQLRKEEDQSKIDELRELFATADLVKFAKYSVQTNENEMYLSNVVRFIEDTKKEEDNDQPDPSVAKAIDNERRHSRERRMTKTAIMMTVVIALAVMAYVVWKVYELLA